MQNKDKEIQDIPCEKRDYCLSVYFISFVMLSAAASLQKAYDRLWVHRFPLTVKKQTYEFN